MLVMARLLLVSLLMLPGHWQTLECTAYTANYESTQKHPSHPLYGITASGATVKEHHTLACPPEWEFGTRVLISDLGTIYTCTDRGGAIMAGHLDIYVADLDDALEFGRQRLTVYVLREE